VSDQTNELTRNNVSTAELAKVGRSGHEDSATVEAQGDGEKARIENPAAAQAQDEKMRPSALLASKEATDMRSRWSAIQIGFVDDPRHAVEMADSLVAEMMQRLAQIFAAQRAQLEGRWSSGQDVSTEDLRLALRQYRSFFDRLLSF
jgi:hypothetical protein